MVVPIQPMETLKMDGVESARRYVGCLLRRTDMEIQQLGEITTPDKLDMYVELRIKRDAYAEVLNGLNAESVYVSKELVESGS